MLRGRRLKHITTLLMDRCRLGLPDDDAGREYLFELLLVMSTVPHAEIKMDHAIRVWAPWMPQDKAAQLLDQINRIPIWERWRTGRELGKRLRLTNGERERMKLWSIRPYNMGMAELRRQRRRKQRECMRRLRETRGTKSRDQWLAENSISREKPWKRDGISRAKWYRRRAALNADDWQRNAKLPEEKLDPEAA